MPREVVLFRKWLRTLIGVGSGLARDFEFRDERPGRSSTAGEDVVDDGALPDDSDVAVLMQTT